MLKKRWLCLCLALGLAAGLLTVPALAAEGEEPVPLESPAPPPEESPLYSGECGDYDSEVNWALYSGGELRITGSGRMDYMGREDSPWYPHRREITSLVVEDGVTSIGSYAFYGLEKLETAEIADSVTEIGSYAFEDCAGLLSIEIPDSVIEVGNSAFSGCSSLADVKLSDNLTVLPDRLFSSCTSLTSIHIPDCVTQMGSDMFRGCTALASVTLPNGLTTLPIRLFSECTSLVSVDIPDSVTEIGSSAFSGCYSLACVNLPEGLTILPDMLFSNCSGLTFIDIPDNVAEIGDSAFYGCEGLTAITLPASVESVDTWAFDSCSNMTSVTFLGDAPEISQNAFSGVDTSPGRFCIYFHSGASGWTAPEWNGWPSACLEATGEYSQLDEGNRNAQGILFTLNESAATATVGDNSANENNAGYTGASGGVVVIPDAVVKDGKSYRVIGIGQNAFSDNQFLQEIQLGSSVSSVIPSAFSGCSQFTSFSVSEENRNYSVQDGILFDAVQYYLYVYPAGKTDLSYTVPETVKTIGPYAFQGAKNLRSVVVPDEVTSIGFAAFAHCTGIREITLPFLGGSRIDDEPFWYVWEFGYRDETPAVERIVITDEGLKGSDFGQHRYDSDTSVIKSITLPFCGAAIPEFCFENCSGLEELIFTDIGPVMTDGVLSIPGQVTEIGESAFYGCNAIRQVDLPAPVTKLGELAFGFCAGIESFSVAEDNPNYSSDKWGVLFAKDRSQLIQYPASRIWPYYNVPAETSSIAEGAFYACKNLVNLYLPDTVKEINRSAVEECPGVTFCVKLGSTADTYVKSNNLTAWYIDNYTLQGIEIYSLPEKTVFAMGEEDFTGLYVAALYGGRPLQAEEYALSYDPGHSGVQTVTVRSGGMTAQFDILLYDGEQEAVLTFNAPSVAGEPRLFAAVYGSDGRMLCVTAADLHGGAVHAVVPRSAAERMHTAKLFQLEDGTWVPLAEAYTLPAA